jgi:lysine-N-methylase
MKALRVESPVFLNWSCHGCSQCCRGGLVITVTDEEKGRIEAQHWTRGDGIDPTAIFAPFKGGHRLGHQTDGACIFLDPAGRCRIHAKHGLAAKPLACRMFPFALHPVGKRVMAGLRFECPSAAANKGAPLSGQEGDLRRLAKEALPDDRRRSPPAILGDAGAEWPDVQRYLTRLDAVLARERESLRRRVLTAMAWLHLIERGRFAGLHGEDGDEILDVLLNKAEQSAAEDDERDGGPGRTGRMFLRMMVLEAAKRAGVRDLENPGTYRRRMLSQGVRFAFGLGTTGQVEAGLGRAAFSQIERFSGGLGRIEEEVLTRYLRMKVQTGDFCGEAFHGRPLIEGFRALALHLVVVIWIARWRALGAGRVTFEDDVTAALAVADHNHGIGVYFPFRVRLMYRSQDLVRSVVCFVR